MSFSSMLQMAKGKGLSSNTPNSKQSETSNKPATSDPKRLTREKASAGVDTNRLYDPTPQQGKDTLARPTTPRASLTRTVKEKEPVRRTQPPEKTTQPTRPINSPTARPITRTPPRATPQPISKPKPAVSASQNKPTMPTAPVGGIAKKKLSFKDVMKQASSIDKAKLEMNLRVSGSPQQQQAQRSSQSSRRKLRSSEGSDTNNNAAAQETPPAPVRQSNSFKSPGIPSERNPSSGPIRRSGPAPIAQPFPELMEKYNRRKEAKKSRRSSRYDEEDEEDLDDFVVDEEEGEDMNQTNEHESIWSIFNRKPKSSYMDDFSDDDMEATGRDIFEEEHRSTAQARREDVEEERKLEEAARKKQLRRGA